MISICALRPVLIKPVRLQYGWKFVALSMVAGKRNRAKGKISEIRPRICSIFYMYLMQKMSAPLHLYQWIWGTLFIFLYYFAFNPVAVQFL